MDHGTRGGLLVNGAPWALMGWYEYGPNDWEGPRGGACDPKLFPNRTRDPIGYAYREKQIRGSGGSPEPPGLLLEPPGLLLTHLHTGYMEYSECLPTLLKPRG